MEMYTYNVSDFSNGVDDPILFKETEEQLPSLKIIRKDKEYVVFIFDEVIDQNTLDNIVGSHNLLSNIYDPDHIISIPLIKRKIRWTSWKIMSLFNHEGSDRVGAYFSIRAFLTPKNNNSSCSIRIINRTDNVNMGEILNQNEGLVEIVANHVPTYPFILEIQAKVLSRGRWTMIENLNLYINSQSFV